MKIEKYVLDRMAYADELKKVHTEISNATKKKDTILSELNELNQARVAVGLDTKNLQDTLKSLNEEISVKQQELSKLNESFEININNKKKTIEALDKEIIAKQKQLDEYNSKKLIDIDGINMKYMEEKAKKLEEIMELEYTISSLNKEKKSIIEWKESEEKQIEKKKEWINNKITELSSREDALVVREEEFTNVKYK